MRLSPPKGGRGVLSVKPVITTAAGFTTAASASGFTGFTTGLLASGLSSGFTTGLSAGLLAAAFATTRAGVGLIILIILILIRAAARAAAARGLLPQVVLAGIILDGLELAGKCREFFRGSEHLHGVNHEVELLHRRVNSIIKAEN